MGISIRITMSEMRSALHFAVEGRGWRRFLMSEVEIYPSRGRQRCDSQFCGNCADFTIRMNFGGKTLFQSKSVDYCVAHFKEFAKKVTKSAVEAGIDLNTADFDFMGCAFPKKEERK
jgi:hypothetical protein